MDEHYHKNKVSGSSSGDRLDIVLSRMFPDYSRSRLQKWIKQEKVRVDGEICRARDSVFEGQTIELWASLEPAQQWQPQELPLDVVFEDEHLIVINKPVGLVVHPGAGNKEGTMSNALLHHYPELTSVPRAGVIHRLDKDTTGLLVIARTVVSHKHLVEQLQRREFERKYIALCNGQMISGGSVDQPIGRHPLQRVRMAVTPAGKEAITHYTVLERFRFHTLIQCQLETGRTHQIRVHMAYIRHPLVGDPVYGGRLKIGSGCSQDFADRLRSFKRQALHAWQLGLVHPFTGETMHWELEIPADMQDLIDAARQDTHQSGEL